MFDKTTAEILKSIVSSSNYYTGNFGDIIHTGKNKVVVHAYISKKAYPTWEPGAKPILLYAYINNEYNKRYRNWRYEENVVKVYKLCENAVKNDNILQQVQKEEDHLCLLRKAKCNVPEVRHCSRNVIVMSLIGTDGVTAPSISTLATSPLKHTEKIYKNIVKDVETWYKTVHLVHGNLSSKNMLYWNKEAHYIGWAHSVKKEHPQALKKLMRDCCFITRFFETRDVQVKPAKELFKDITGRTEDTVSNMSQSKDLWKTQSLTNPNRVPSAPFGSEIGRSYRFKR